MPLYYSDLDKKKAPYLISIMSLIGRVAFTMTHGVLWS